MSQLNPGFGQPSDRRGAREARRRARRTAEVLKAETEIRRADSDYEYAPHALQRAAGSAEALRRTWNRLPWPAKALIGGGVLGFLEAAGILSAGELIESTGDLIDSARVALTD